MRMSLYPIHVTLSLLLDTTDHLIVCSGIIVPSGRHVHEVVLMLPGCSLSYWLGDHNGYHNAIYFVTSWSYDVVSWSLDCENHPHSTIPLQAVLPILVSDTDLTRGVIGHLASLPTLANRSAQGLNHSICTLVISQPPSLITRPTGYLCDAKDD